MSSNDESPKVVMGGGGASDILVSVAKRLISSAPQSRCLGKLRWHDMGNPILHDLAIEGFVNGGALIGAGMASTAYRSPLVDEALSAIDLNRSDLRNLSRSPDQDARIDSAPWAESFRRERLVAASNHPTVREPRIGSMGAFDVTSWLASELDAKFPSAVHEGDIFLLKLEESGKCGIYGCLTFQNGMFPLMLKPYVLLAFDVPFEAVLIAARQNGRLLHPIWILSPGLGGLVVSRNREQLFESFEAFLECFDLLRRFKGSSLKV